MKKPKYAYAIWPWGLESKDQMVQALRDIKEIGYEAFESVESAVDLFEGNVDEFRSIVDEYGVRPASFYFWLRGEETEDVNRIKRKMTFLSENNVHQMSVQAPKSAGRPATPAELRRTLRIIKRIGTIANEYDVVPCVHPHHGTLVMYENEVEFVMENTDPEYVSFGPDTAHLAAGGCDAVEMFDRHKDRIAFTHLKDLKMESPMETDRTSDKGFDVYENFRELGEGDLDFDSIFRVLKSINYDGYLTAELDKSRFTNKESALMNMRYLRAHFG